MNGPPTSLTEVALFSELDAEERQMLAASVQRRVVAAGAILFRRGDVADHFYLIRRGRVRFFDLTDTGERVVLQVAGPGDVFGEAAFFDGGSRLASAEAIEEAELEGIGRAEMIALIRKHPSVGLDLLAAMSRYLRSTNEVLRTTAVRNVNVAEEEQMTLGAHLADRVASFGGSWHFIILFGGILTAWVTINALILSRTAFDPYPFILLNLVLSSLAAFQAPIIMMSQNRQSTKDRLNADLDFEVNVRAEREIAHLHTKVDQLYEQVQTLHARLDDPSRRDGLTRPV